MTPSEERTDIITIHKLINELEDTERCNVLLNPERVAGHVRVIVKNLK